MADSTNINDKPASDAGKSADSQYAGQISSMTSFMNKVQSKTDNQIKSMDKRIDNIMKYQLEAKKSNDSLMKSSQSQLVANKELAANTSKILSGLNSTISNLAVGTQKITKMTADSSKDLIVQYSKAISQDINYNKQNMLAMTLSQATPIFGYFASKFMETDVFQSAADKIKSNLGDAISESLIAAKGLGRTVTDAIGDFFTKKQKVELSTESKSYLGGKHANETVAGQIKKLKRQGKMRKAAAGGDVQRDGYVNVHAGEVITPAKNVDSMTNSLRENVDLMRRLVKENQGGGTPAITAAEKTRAWQKEMLKATLDMRVSMVGTTSQIRIAWQRMLTEHPLFRSLRNFTDILQTSIMAPFKFLFGMRGGYRRFLPKGNNAFQNMNATLGLIFTMFADRLDRIIGWQKKAYALAGGDVKTATEDVKKDSEDSKEWSLLGKTLDFLKTSKDSKDTKKKGFAAITAAISDYFEESDYDDKLIKSIFGKVKDKATEKAFDFEFKHKQKFNKAQEMYRAGKNTISGIPPSVAAAASSMYGAMGDRASAFAHDVEFAHKGKFDATRGLYRKGLGYAKSGISNVRERIPGLSEGGIPTKDGIFQLHKGEAVFSSAKLASILDSMKLIAEKLYLSSKGMAGKAWAGMKSAPGRAMGAGRSALSSLFTSAKGAFNASKAKITESKIFNTLFPSVEKKLEIRTKQHFNRLSTYSKDFASQTEQNVKDHINNTAKINTKWSDRFKKLTKKSLDYTADIRKESEIVKDKFRKGIEKSSEEFAKFRDKRDKDHINNMEKIKDAAASKRDRIRLYYTRKGMTEQEKIMRKANKKTVDYQEKVLKKIEKRQNRMAKRQKWSLKSIFDRQARYEKKKLKQQKKLENKRKKLEARRNKAYKKLNALKEKVQKRREKYENAIEAQKLKWKNKQDAKAAKIEAKIKFQRMKRDMMIQSKKAKLDAIKNKKLYKLQAQKAKIKMKEEMAKMKKETKAMKAQAKIDAKNLKKEIREMRKKQWQERKNLFKQRIKYAIETPKRLAKWKKEAATKSKARMAKANETLELLRKQNFQSTKIGKLAEKHFPSFTKFGRKTFDAIKAIPGGVVSGMKKASGMLWKILMFGLGFIKDIIFAGMSRLGPMIAGALTGAVGAASTATGAVTGAMGSGLGMAAGAMGVSKLAAGTGIGSALLGGYMSVKDAMAGAKKSKEWGTSKTAAGIGGALGGTKKGVAGAGRGALKGAALGAAIGTPFGGPLGMAIGGAIGAVAGGILGAVGGENIAKGMQYVGEKIKSIAKAAWKFVMFPVRFMKKFLTNIVDDFKKSYAKDGVWGIVKETGKKLFKWVTWPMQIMLKITKTMRENIANWLSDYIEKVPFVGKKLAKKMRSESYMKPESDPQIAAKKEKFEDIISKANKNRRLAAKTTRQTFSKLSLADRGTAVRAGQEAYKAAREAGYSRKDSRLIRDEVKQKKAQSILGAKDIIKGKSLKGLSPEMKQALTTAALAFNEETGRKLQINSARRTFDQQQALFNKYGPGRAARPGSSIHESGYAVDLQSKDVGLMKRKGILQAAGLHTPIYDSKGKELWHVELSGIDRQAIKSRLRSGERFPHASKGGYVKKTGLVKVHAGELIAPLSPEIRDKIENAVVDRTEISKQGAAINSLQTKMLIRENQKAQKESMDQLTKSNAEQSNAVVANINNVMSSNSQSTNQTNNSGGGGNANTAFDPLARQILQGDLS